MNAETPSTRPTAAASMASKVIAAAGANSVQAYIEQVFPPNLVAIGYYTAENAETWLDLPKFMCWLGHRAQKLAATPPVSPMKGASLSRGHPPPVLALTPSILLAATIPTILHFRRPGLSSPPAPPKKRKRNETRPEPDAYDSDSDVVVVKKKPKGKKAQRAPKASRDEGLLEITRQLHLLEIRDVKNIFSTWAVPQTDIENDFVYRIDLTGDSREWKDPKSNPLSMAAIIKSEDQDAWGDGTGGALGKPTSVTVLDGVPCQAASHKCQGVWVCNQLDEALLEGHERYAPDDSDMHELFDAERTVNVRETSSMALRAAAFYSEIHSKLCPHVENGVQCTGLPVYRRLKMVQLFISGVYINLDGKGGFIGCQKYSRSQPRSHRFITINRDVKEELIQELLSNNGRFISDVNVNSESAVSDKTQDNIRARYGPISEHSEL
ncbi:hypothetical protein C8F04DRAFT_1183058 [Mycena alexandri]|uniref:Uncharacterized protein n=1 Tax=Mycena alexandri TaxID=1745969 RepID=A0AAD6SZC3_9AGAR|nr:hypothetical protein C8F04DRAFT_1183058 [Mycena alexandri]